MKSLIYSAMILSWTYFVQAQKNETKSPVEIVISKSVTDRSAFTAKNTATKPSLIEQIKIREDEDFRIVEEEEAKKNRKNTPSNTTSKLLSAYSGSILIPTDSVVIQPETPAEFFGGEFALRKYFSENLIFPEKYINQKITSKVFVRFVIERTGEISNVYLVKGPNDECNREAMRVVRKMPIWEPAVHFGQRVTSIQTLPISFLVK
jgi:periplasmic protein TonB